ncbi:YkyB family protein [Gracilibacillus alcaliphilus]|uniref:YkyB family protein n=1 Tax=Gracilibacillus alcaliphilus TaxID=1401441 RepID=UPI0019573C3A|nr:YkyB family protein [Gracilibacillus alcaliphilus]MBM7679367.1 hypothetical protein [Gracilibacillus alcaliphilus]
MGYPTIKQIADALFIVNRHAKTAPDPSQLYRLKKEAIAKLLKEQKAIKKGLHFSNNPKNSQQHSVLLVQIDDYYFHLPPDKNDMHSLPHLGHLDESHRNQRPSLSLNQAKRILQQYLGKDTYKKTKTPSPNKMSFYYRRK